MAFETMTTHDLAVAEIHVKSANRIEETFRRIGEKNRPFLREATTSKISNLKHDSEAGIISVGAPLNKTFGQTYNNSYTVNWGLQFPSNTSSWTEIKPPLSVAAHVYVSVYSNDETAPLAFEALGPESLPGHWHRMGDGVEIVTLRPVHELVSSNNDITDALADWIAARLSELKPVLKLLTKASEAEPV